MLSLSIPTRNRSLGIAALLHSIEISISSIPACRDPIVVNIFDNNSDPDHFDHLTHLASIHRRYITRLHPSRMNIGMRSNIVRALHGTKSDYVWLLSDHMLVTRCIYSLQNLISSTLPDIALFEIAGYPTLSIKRDSLTTVSRLNLLDSNKLLFNMGNISTNVYSNKILMQFANMPDSAVTNTDYPHLLALSYLKLSSTIIYAERCSHFNTTFATTNSYDRLAARYIDFPKQCRKISPLLFQGFGRILFIPPRLYITSLANQLIDNVFNANLSSPYPFLCLFSKLCYYNQLYVTTLVFIVLLFKIFSYPAKFFKSLVLGLRQHE